VFRPFPLPVATPAFGSPLARIRAGLSISQGIFNAAQILTQSRKNELAFFAMRHFGAKQFEDEWVCGLANPPDRCVGSLCFQATQPPAIDKCFCILADGHTAKLGDPIAGQARNN
jgi:hypothetical protein